MSYLRHIAEAVSLYVTESNRTRLLTLIASYDDVVCANRDLNTLTGVRDFFQDSASLNAFQRVLARPALDSDNKIREWGDYQTPLDLAHRVCQYLIDMGVSPQVVIEPTYGAGNFILAALDSFTSTEIVYGVEIQNKYQWNLKIPLLLKALDGQRFHAELALHQDDIFTHHFPDSLLAAQNLLIIGNPPWVTNSELGAIKARNIPAKSNIKALSGLDAKTGKSNFDIGEFVLLRLLELFAGRSGCFAMLCKNSIIKNIVEALPQRHFSVSNIRALEIDARREFGAAVEASLLVMDIGAPTVSSICQVSTLAQPAYVSRTFGWAHNKFMSNIDELHLDLDGTSPLIWRQGLKHDCARVMELDVRNGALMNGSGEVADIEDQEVYWLLKSSDLRTFAVTQPRKKVIVTQRRIGEDTTTLRQSAPKLWEYLVRNSALLDKRKSSIYHNKPRFSIFGVGEYTFKPYKVAISGLYKEPCFSIVSPFNGRPVILDDTCYLLGFDTYLAALFTASILNSFIVRRFLTSIVFRDAKRPYTKEILMRIDLAKAARYLSLQVLQAYWDDQGYLPRVTVHDSDYDEYKQSLLNVNNQREALQLNFGI